ncbi:hypothetical protein LEP1GSC049_1582 [Leptospira kirschneri serovar Cynopteri str. 3522 CT]|nr:hypothetical protein LEP1GSC064_1144 [Leptospira kirschneri serovar Grippotyphosa str. Moskva]EKR07943.1 hypothetical protein LEP1GSC122_2273 [Leptospira kirschneri serovar Valbuzzi str. 200702274]EMK03126.1 hypothetical protein LEP1GSC176_2518 [Leptospira kirschneri str. MMD1493]EPG49211.1 hypothetical protein LEP1GSC049_1582 [Leptospira kirschneri serovar Cynopteri str. 3522 CT]
MNLLLKRIKRVPKINNHFTKDVEAVQKMAFNPNLLTF